MKTNDVKLKNNTIKVLGKGAKEREGGYVNSLTVMGF
jgi:site-specific recombinase XerC